ncbi:MAG: polymerase sigma-70 factor, subfamily [Acidobacteriota bacterium]|jgi:RNA polymerase sigma-70 factor (ECF subfamily)|nr:polymerase sigma-70 factor, subfamily [Acidobacteriota bacterium]
MDHEDSASQVQRALAGDQTALTRLVAGLTPVVQARVARTLLARRSRLGSGRDVRQEVEDLSQEVFLSLFSRSGHILRSWQAERGLSLENFVGLIAERQVVSFLRSSKRNPWKEDPTAAEDLDATAPDRGPEEATANREQLSLLLERLREKLSPLGHQLFVFLFVQEMTVPETMAASGLSADAVYAWRSRLRRLAQQLLAELSGKPSPARKTQEEDDR